MHYDNGKCKVKFINVMLLQTNFMVNDSLDVKTLKVYVVLSIKPAGVTQ